MLERAEVVSVGKVRARFLHTSIASKMSPSLQFMAGDRLVETMVSREMMLGMLVGYLGMIVGLRAFMKKRAPYSLKVPMQVRTSFHAAPCFARLHRSRTRPNLVPAGLCEKGPNFFPLSL